MPKKKKSKEEKEAERVALEEEERRAAEDELRKQEEERIRREEADRKRKEELATARREELERFKEEVDDESPAIAFEAQQRADAVREADEAAEWAKFTACNDRPDPAVESDLSSHINMWRAQSTPTLEETLAAVDYTDQIVGDLLRVLAAAKTDGDTERWAYGTAALAQLTSLSMEKLDVATQFTMKHAGELIDPDTPNELMLQRGAFPVKFALWLLVTPKQFRNRLVHFEALGIDVDVPKTLTKEPLALRAITFPFDHDAFAHDCVDRAVGFVAKIELLELPQPAMRINGWAMRPLMPTADTVTHQNYPKDNNSISPPAAGTAMNIKVSFDLAPGTVLLSDAPRVGWWDPRIHAWSEEGITDVEYDAEARRVEFHTLKLTTLAVIQERHADLPLRGWSLAPSREFPALEARLTLRTPRLELVIAVREGEVQLVGPADLPELAALRAAPMAPGLLVQRLALCGINIAPSDADAVATHETGQPSVPKERALEAKAAAAAAEVAAAFDVLSSPFNQGLGASAATFFLRETAAFGGGEDEEAEARPAALLEVDEEVPTFDNKFTPAGSTTGIKCSVVRVAAGAKSFEVDAHENRANTSVYFKNAVEKSKPTPEAKERMQTATIPFKQTVEDLFSLVRPFSFA